MQIALVMAVADREAGEGFDVHSIHSHFHVVNVGKESASQGSDRRTFNSADQKEKCRMDVADRIKIYGSIQYATVSKSRCTNHRRLSKCLAL